MTNLKKKLAWYKIIYLDLRILGYIKLLLFIFRTMGLQSHRRGAGEMLRKGKIWFQKEKQ